jgi:hypothetical protein
MLSPNATKLVAAIVGIFGATYGSTTIGKEQESVRLCASVAVQTTVVVPTGNVLPLAGAHDVFTDGVPPFTDAAPYETARPVMLDAGAGTGAAGHRIFGPPADGLVGPGDEPQAAAHNAVTVSTNTDAGTLREKWTRSGTDEEYAPVPRGNIVGRRGSRHGIRCAGSRRAIPPARRPSVF